MFFIFIKVSTAKTHTFIQVIRINALCKWWYQAHRLIFPASSVGDLAYSTVGNSVFVLSVVCLSDNSTVTTDLGCM